MKPDLTFRHDRYSSWISAELAAQLGVAPGGQSYAFVGVNPHTERGDSFLLAFNEATDGAHLGEHCEEDDRIVEILELRIPPERWDAFQRRARLASVTMVEEA